MDMEQKPKFDLVVTHRDPKSGMITHTTPYILRRVGEVGSSEKTDLWERPSGSGNLFDAEMNPVGRWVYEEQKIKGKVVKVGHHEPDAEHIAFVPPLTADEKLRQEVAATQVELAETKRELAAIKAEREKASTSAKVATKTKEPGV